MTTTLSAAAMDRARVCDLRRRQTRDLADRILLRSSLLPPHERTLIEAVYNDGRTAADLACLIGTNPRSLRRQIRRIVGRLTSPEFTFVLGAMDHWPTSRRRVARACFIHGRTMREAADDLRMSLHAVRQHHGVIGALFDEQRP